jgi:hypothetical protein
MGLVKALFSIVAGYVLSNTAAWGADQCPAGPFETDVGVIAAAIASQPLKSRVWDASPELFGFPTQLTDGAFWTSSGGLASPGRWLYYDAKRYVAVRVVAEWGSRKARTGQGPNQMIRRNARGVFTTTVTRPTPAQARELACLTNQLAMPSLKEGSSTAAQSAASTLSPPKSASNGRDSENCNSQAAEIRKGMDEYSWMFELHSHGSVLEYDAELPCATRAVLLSEMEGLANSLIDEAIASGKGK